MIRSLESVPLNTSDIDRSELDISEQVRTNPLPWKGQFSPQLIEVLLRTYAADGTSVLDPFVGSGTVLGECARRGLGCVGAEVNPAATILARLYEYVTSSKNDRLNQHREASSRIETLITEHQPALFSTTVAGIRPQDVAALAHRERAKQVKGLIAATLVLSDPAWNIVAPGRLLAALRRVRDLLITLPESLLPIAVFECDARQLPISDASIDLVITSPPYINVFNYHQQYRPAVEALGHDVLDVARSEIGSNRKHRMNRFLTVIQYSLDMAAVLRELLRVTRTSARMIFVVGRESKVRGLSIYNGDLLCALAAGTAGLKVIMRQERAFTNRFGERIVEDILHFTKVTEKPESGSGPTAISSAVLEELLSRAKADVYDDIRQALRCAGDVRPSPLYQAAL